MSFKEIKIQQLQEKEEKLILDIKKMKMLISKSNQSSAELIKMAKSIAEKELKHIRKLIKEIA